MKRALLCLLAACGGNSGSDEPGDITVTVTSPNIAEELLASESPMIHVTGTVATTNPSFGTLESFVNGTQVEVAADGSFEGDVVPTLGINHIKVDGGDGGPLVAQELDVMWAAGYVAPVSGAGFDVEHALSLDLGQRFFDARQFGTTLDLTTDPIVAHDLASALELILWNIDLATLLPDQLQFGGSNASLDVTIPSAAPSQILIDAKIIDTPTKAIDVNIDLNGVFLGMNGTFTFGNRTLIVDGGIAADMHATARLELGTAQDGSIAVTVTNVTAQVGPLVPSFTGQDGDELDALINIGNSDFRIVIEGLISEQLIPTFTDKVPPILEQLLGAADKLLDNQMFTLDPGLGTAVTLTLDSSVGALDVVPGPAIGTSPGHVAVRENMTIRTDVPGIHDTRGAPQLDDGTTVPSEASSGVHLTLELPFLNSLLHSLWNGGLLEGHADFGGLSANVSSKLSPVVRPTPPESPCKIDNVRCDLVLELGQLEVELPDFEQTFVVNAQAGARVLVDGNTVSLSIEMTPTLYVWETSAVHGTLSTDAVHDVIINLVWPELFGAIGEKLTFTLPLPDLAALGLDQLSPNLANAQLLLDVHSRPDVTPSFLTLGADLELSTPPLP